MELTGPLSSRKNGRYAAFISYSHADAAWAQRIHRQLEAYRLPRDITKNRARLGRIFLDRSELSSSSSLSEAIQHALDDADALILICSPRSAASKWVNEEVRRFRANGLSARIFCLIVDGDPAGPTAPSPFPAALLETLPGESAPEPLAADVRPGHDRPRDALLKLVAGIAAVPFDSLRRREQVRRQRRLSIVAGVSTTLLAVMTVLTVFAVLARREAERQRDTAFRTSTFMRNIFDQARPEVGGQNITVRDMLDRSAKETLDDPVLQQAPETRSELLTSLAQVFAKLGSLDRSESLLKAAAIPGDDDLDRVISQAALAAELALQRGDMVAARSVISRALKRRSTGTDEDKGERIKLLTLSGQVWDAQGQAEKAQANFLRARALSLASSPPDRGSAATALTAAARVDVDNGNLIRAEQRLRQVIAERRALGQPLHPNVLTALNSLGALAIKRGDARGAEGQFRQALALQQKILGDQHLDTATSRSNLGRALVEQRKFAEAKATLLSARATFIAQGGPRYDSLANLDDSLGLALGGLGDVAGARAAFSDGLAIAREHKMPKEIELLADRAELECAAGAPAAGLPLAAEARAALARFALPEPWRAARIDLVEASCHLAAGNRAAALPLIRRATAPVITRWGTNSLFGRKARALAARTAQGV